MRYKSADLSPSLCCYNRVLQEFLLFLIVWADLLQTEKRQGILGATDSVGLTIKSHGTDNK